MLKWSLVTWIMLTICVHSSAQNPIRIYRDKSGPTHWGYIIVDNDTAYAYNLDWGHWLRFGPIDTLYSNDNSVYTSKKRQLTIAENSISGYSTNGNTQKRDRRMHQLRKKQLGEWHTKHQSVIEAPHGNKTYADALNSLYEKYKTKFH